MYEHWYELLNQQPNELKLKTLENFEMFKNLQNRW